MGALTISQQNTNKGNTSGPALTFGSNTGAVGDMLLVIVAADNNGTGGISSVSSVTDAVGNTYNLEAEIVNNPSGAATGCTLSFFTSVLTSALTAQNITVNFSPNTALKTAQVYRIQPAAGEVPLVRAVGAGATGTSTTPSITNASVENGDTIFGGLAAETDDAITGDADTSNGSWSTQWDNTWSGASDALSISVASQYKTVTAAAAQTFNPTIAGAQDWAVNWIVVYSGIPATSGMFEVF